MNNVPMSLQHLLILKLSVAVRALQMAVLLCLKDVSEDVRNFWRSVLLLDSVHDMLRNIDIAHHLDIQTGTGAQKGSPLRPW